MGLGSDVCRVRASPLILHKGSRQVEALRLKFRTEVLWRARGTGQVHPWGNGPAGGGAGRGGVESPPIKGQPAQFHGETQPSTTKTDPYFREARKMHLNRIPGTSFGVDASPCSVGKKAGPVWPTAVSQSVLLHRGDSTASPSFSFTPPRHLPAFPGCPTAGGGFSTFPHIRVLEDTE